MENYQASLNIAAAAVGPTSKPVGDVYYIMAGLHERLLDYSAAGTCYLRAAAVYRECHGHNHARAVDAASRAAEVVSRADIEGIMTK